MALRGRAGASRCETILGECDGHPVSSIITRADNTLRMCCGGAIIPPLNAARMTYNTDRDRVRSSRIVKANSGDSLVIIIINFK